MPVPRSASPTSVFALAAVLCAMVAAAPTSAALAQAPDPDPLWKAFPLTPGRTTGAKHAERPNGAPLVVEGTRRTRTSADASAPVRTGVPLGVAIAFYLSLGILSAAGVAAATRYVVRRRAQPVICEISWSPGEQGAAFLATAQQRGQDEWVVARSGRFDRSTAEPPAVRRGRARLRPVAQRPLRRRVAALRARPRMVGDEAAPPGGTRHRDPGARCLSAGSRAGR